MKEYSNGEIVVYWDPDLCIHARECTKGLPQVFRREKTPWIDMSGADSKEIMKVIDRCPSGALSYKRVGPSGAADSPAASIRVMKDGPLLVEGSCLLLDQEGNASARKTPFALCRCGRSRKKPFCDGTHSSIGFKDSV